MQLSIQSSPSLLACPSEEIITNEFASSKTTSIFSAYHLLYKPKGDPLLLLNVPSTLTRTFTSPVYSVDEMEETGASVVVANRLR